MKIQTNYRPNFHEMENFHEVECTGGHSYTFIALIPAQED